tara:strand:+ start:2504 stop:2848 length:345 start_codon:yes stop_codon:yes gene_type:complete
MYYIYHKDHVPEQVANRHKYHAIYGDFYLFISGIERETGIPPENVLDVASMGFNHPYDPEGEGLTGEQLLALFANLASPDYVQTGAEGHLLEPQGKYIQEMLFPPAEEQEEVLI